MKSLQTIHKTIGAVAALVLLVTLAGCAAQMSRNEEAEPVSGDALEAQAAPSIDVGGEIRVTGGYSRGPNLHTRRGTHVVTRSGKAASQYRPPSQVSRTGSTRKANVSSESDRDWEAVADIEGLSGQPVRPRGGTVLAKDIDGDPGAVRNVTGAGSHSVAVTVKELTQVGQQLESSRTSGPKYPGQRGLMNNAEDRRPSSRSKYMESAQFDDGGDDDPTTQVESNTEAYNPITDNPFLLSYDHPLSTFSIDVDTASYSNMRRFLNSGQLPPKSAVRIEELVNYFNYHYDAPVTEDPFAVSTEVATCPWNEDHRLLRIGIKGQELDMSERPASNLVFLLDVSGSMNNANKLPLVQQSLRLLVNQLDARDRIAMVVYAGASGLVLPSTCADDGPAILEAIDRLQAGGSTNGGAGIELAYKTAEENFIKDGINRVILCTDGDFNVGVSSEGELVRMIEEKRQSGVFLSVLGFGTGNLQDSKMEQLADKGNGNYGYVDSLNEARKIFVEEMGSTLVAIAKDVKIQIEFNPTKVGAYRLIGYENRLLRKQDFNDDTKDAGEIGAGHCVTALYEIVPAGMENEYGTPETLKYQMERRLTGEAFGPELVNLKLRHKEPDADESQLQTVAVMDDGFEFGSASEDFRWAAAVAAFGMVLRDSPHKGSATLDDALAMAQSSLGADERGYRTEFVSLIQKAREIEGGAGEPLPKPIVKF